jgi:trk system potassium uptake protein TrkH
LLDIRPVVSIIGLFLIVLAGFTVLPLGVSLAAGDGEWVVFAAAAAITLFFGLAMMLSCGGTKRRTDLRQAFLIAVGTWAVLPLFAALPFRFGSADLTATDAVFEAMSGLTTTGSTVFPDVGALSPAVLVWRSGLQWLGGIAIILMAVTLLPTLRVGGMQVFKSEAFDTPDKIFTRVHPIAWKLIGLYAGLTALWCGLYRAAGMSFFDAANHAMTTLSTGGFSTASDSLGHWRSPAILIVATAGMIVAALPFALYLQAAGGAWKPLLRDGQVRVFLATLGLAALVIAAWLVADSNYDLGFALLGALFHTTAILTGTGYSATDIQLWGGLPVALLFVLQYVGGCAGSTTCGFKIFRFQLLYAAARVQVSRMLRPHLMLVPQYNGRPLQASVADAVMGFFFLYALSVAWLTIGLSYLGLDFVTAISGASTAISNVGPGFGEIIGPTGNFSSLPDAAKWMLALGMLLGRLEILSVLVLFQPSFWRE